MNCILEVVRARACYKVWKETEGELTKEELVTKVLTADILDSVFFEIMPKIPHKEIEETIFHFGIQKAIDEYMEFCGGVVGVVNADELYITIIKKEFREWVEGEDCDVEDFIEMFNTEEPEYYATFFDVYIQPS